VLPCHLDSSLRPLLYGFKPPSDQAEFFLKNQFRHSEDETIYDFKSLWSWAKLVLLVHEHQDDTFGAFSVLGEPGACHVEPDLQPGDAVFTVRNPAELESVSVWL
jgi:hypothetical protein